MVTYRGASPIRRRFWAICASALLLEGCSSLPRFEGQVEVLTTANGQALTEADCVVQTGAGSWNLRTPGVATVGEPAGDLRVVCNKAGYRSSEVILRSGGDGRLSASGARVGVGMGGGFGGYSGVGVSLGFGFPLSQGRRDYPSRVVVEMTPLPPGS